MSDNTKLNPGSPGGDTVRTLDRTGTGIPKTEVVTLDLGSGDGRSEFVSGFPLPITFPDIPVDDDGIQQISLSSSTMDSIEILFRQLIAVGLRGG